MKVDDMRVCVSQALSKIEEFAQARKQVFLVESIRIYSQQIAVIIKEDGLEDLSPRRYELYSAPDHDGATEPELIVPRGGRG